MLHFSCHGVKDESGELYFATTNTKLRRLGATAVAADFVNRRMNRSRSQRIVLLLDCCHAGAFARGVDAAFRFQVTNPEHGGADGLAFVVQNDGASSIGVHGLKYGGGIGYEGLRQSLAVEFDTSQQWYPEFPMAVPGSSDPDGNHISIHTRGQRSNSADEVASLKTIHAIPHLKDGRIHTVRIGYSPGRLEVYLDDPGRPALAITVNIAQALGLSDGKAWVGLTAATGGIAEEHDVWPLSWQDQ